MKQSLLSLYRFIFCRPLFFKLNLHLFKLSLRGIGILNSEGDDVTGETSFLKHLATTNQIKTVIDVGANLKVYGEDELKETRIFAFEPNPTIFKALKKKRHSKLVRIFPNAVSYKNGTSKLWDFADDAELKSTQPTSTLGSLNRKVIEKLHGQKAQSFSVKTITLDTFCQQHKIDSIDLLKIDVEGHELQVLKGAKTLLRQQRIGIIQFEFNEMQVFEGVFFRDFVELLKDFTFYRLLPNGLFPLGEYRPLTHEIFGFQNVVAVSKKLN